MLSLDTAEPGNMKNKSPQDRHGAVTVEFAICAPLLFLMTFTLLEFSRFVFVKHSLQMVAYEAARVGVVPGATNEHVEARAKNLLSASGMRNVTLKIDPSEINGSTEKVTVSVNCSFKENSWLPPTFLTSAQIAKSITLEHENKAFIKPSNTNIMELIGDNSQEPVDE